MKVIIDKHQTQFLHGLLIIYISRMVLKKCRKTAQKVLFIGEVEFNPLPPGFDVAKYSQGF